MLLDPFTIVAQVVNFAILVWALKHFLYDRVIAAMDEREATIAARLHDAEQRESDAVESAADYERRRLELESRQKEMLDDARADAERHRKQLVADARVEVENLRDRWERAFEADQRESEQELRRRTAREVVEISRGALSDLAGVELESAVVDLALEHLSADTASFGALLGDLGPEQPLVVRTAFELSGDRRNDIERRLRAAGLSPDHSVEFEQNEHLVVGVELDGNGVAVSWHADDYLERLEATMHELIEAADHRTPGR